MLDLRREAVLVHDRQTGAFQDKTREIAQLEREPGDKVAITFRGGRRFSYRSERVRVLRNAQPLAIPEEARVEVAGEIWNSVFSVLIFQAPEGAWAHIFYRRKDGEGCSVHPASQVRVLTGAGGSGTAAAVREYWGTIASGLDKSDPLRRGHERLSFIRPDSALAAYLSGSPIESRELPGAPIYPFRCNVSQRAAVESALTRSISVIEGPPGTGKTETILNLIANIVMQRGTVAVVSHTNAAVDNVREKLDELGFGHVLANLGRKERRERFFEEQPVRNARVAEFTASTPATPDERALTDLDKRLRRLQGAERDQAERRQQLDAFRLERSHFERQLHDELPDLENLPLLRRSSERLLDYIAESGLQHEGIRPGLLRRIGNYFRYGPTRELDPGDTALVLALQRAYYDKRIAELEAELNRLDSVLHEANFDELAQQHQHLSADMLHVELSARYRSRQSQSHQIENYKRNFRDFVEDYPAVLSTCHSLRDCVPESTVLDYLIIDEASQVNPLVAALAMSRCRNVVVVGDSKQLSPVEMKSQVTVTAPDPAYDFRKSILESLHDLHGEALPRVLLREHYRCDPVIIGFCNKSFYGGELIPFTTRSTWPPMLVWRTAEGNHMRQYRDGGRMNQREVDVIHEEVIPQHCRGVDDADIGVTTPYRRQVDTAEDVLDSMQVDTVHKFQGRQKRVVILTTVLDETWRGRSGLTFVDDPKLVNVAVSRAIERFVLVTNHGTLPRSRNIRDLVGHIRYHGIDEGVLDSEVVSVFDLLYQNYARRLRPLARRRKRELRHKSEDIAWTVLHDVLAEQRYRHLRVVPQVLLDNLLPDRDLLDEPQRRYVRNRASLDFVVYNRVTNEPVLSIEVDGFEFHANKPEQLRRDELKNEIMERYCLRLLRLPTTGSHEPQRIRQALDEADAAALA